MNNNRIKWSAIIALIWLTSVISLYYVNHKPIEPAFALRLVKIFGQMGAGLWVLVLSGGLGGVLLPDLSLSPLTSLTLRAGLGLGIISVIVLVMGTVLGIASPVIWILMIGASLLFYKQCLVWLSSAKGIACLWRESKKTEKLIAAGLCLLVSANLLIALAPPTRFDALVYHLALPQSYLHEGQIIYIPQNIFWGMPQVGEMLYTLAMAVAGIEAATVLSVFVALLTLLGILGYVSERLTVSAGWIALAVLLAGSTLAGSMHAGYVDWFALLFGFCAIVGLDQWCDSGKRKWLFIAGVFAGLALSSKYTAGVLFLSGAGLILWRSGNKPGRIIKETMVYLCSGVAASLAWLVKNFLATGNPFYPFFVPAGEMDAFRQAHYNLMPWGGDIESLLLPIRATFQGIEGTPGYSASIGPLLLGFGPLLALGWKNRSMNQQQTLKTAAIVSILGLISWSIASRFSGYLIQSRLYFAFFPALGLVAAGGYLALHDIRWLGIRFGRVADIMVLLVFGFSLLQMGVETIRKGALPAVLGLRTQDEYLDENLGWFAPVMRSISRLPEESKILMLWEPRSLYCLPLCYPDEVLDRWLHDRYLSGSNKNILSSWKEAGFTHLLVNHFGADFLRENDNRYTDTDWQSLEELLANLPAIENFDDAYTLYSLGP